MTVVEGERLLSPDDPVSANSPEGLTEDWLYVEPSRVQVRMARRAPILGVSPQLEHMESSAKVAEPLADPMVYPAESEIFSGAETVVPGRETGPPNPVNDDPLKTTSDKFDDIIKHFDEPVQPPLTRVENSLPGIIPEVTDDNEADNGGANNSDESSLAELLASAEESAGEQVKKRKLQAKALLALGGLVLSGGVLFGGKIGAEKVGESLSHKLVTPLFSDTYTPPAPKPLAVGVHYVKQGSQTDKTPGREAHQTHRVESLAKWEASHKLHHSSPDRTHEHQKSHHRPHHSAKKAASVSEQRRHDTRQGPNHEHKQIHHQHQATVHVQPQVHHHLRQTNVHKAEQPAHHSANRIVGAEHKHASAPNKAMHSSSVGLKPVVHLELNLHGEGISAALGQYLERHHLRHNQTIVGHITSKILHHEGLSWQDTMRLRMHYHFVVFQQWLHEANKAHNKSDKFKTLKKKTSSNTRTSRHSKLR